MEIREASSSDLDHVLTVEREAFGYDKEADLVRAILADASAAPTLSLLAWQEGRPVGHVLFSTVTVRGTPAEVSASILAPLAVVPDAQNQAIGATLIERGLHLLTASSVGLVFVLGHPGYYPRHGFEPAGRLGLEAPYPIPEKHADAWMVQALRPGLIGRVRGKVSCCNALDQPEHWRE